MTRGMIIDNVKMLIGWFMINIPNWIDSASMWFTLISTILGAMVMVVTYKRARIKLRISEMELKEKEKKNEANR